MPLAEGEKCQGPGTFGLRTADWRAETGNDKQGWSCETKPKLGWMGHMEKKEPRVRVGSVGEQSVPNKANLQNKTRAGRPRHETRYGVTTSMPDCTNKVNSAAGTCTAIRGERGRSPYRAKQSQFERRQVGGDCMGDFGKQSQPVLSSTSRAGNGVTRNASRRHYKPGPEA